MTTTTAPTSPGMRIALRGDLLDFSAEPAWGDVESPAVRYRPDHWLLIDDGKINTWQGKAVFAEMFATGAAAAQIVQEKGLAQESDAGAIEALCAQAMAASPKAVAEYQAGKTQAINSLKGQVMKLSQGKANPNVVGEILARLLAA